MRAITNGVHVPTWVASELSKLFEAHIAPDWRQRHDDEQMWDAIDAIPDDELWDVRQALRNYLFAFIRERARHALDRTSASAPARSSPRARCSTPTR